MPLLLLFPRNDVDAVSDCVNNNSRDNQRFSAVKQSKFPLLFC